MKKTIFSPRNWLLSLLTITVIFNACTKRQNDVQFNPKDKVAEETEYLKLKDPKELANLIDKVGQMSDVEYENWKREVGLKSTLYDRFVNLENKMLTNELSKVPIQDSGFFYVNKELLSSKNGVPLDRVLNYAGVIQIGNFVIRYENNSIYYAKNIKENSGNLDIIAGKASSAHDLNNIATRLSASTKPLKISSNIKTADKIMIASDHQVIPGSASQQTFNFNVFYRRDDYGNSRRHWTELYEQYIIVPVEVNGSTVTWSVAYRFYMQFSQQKKVLFTWNTYPSVTNGNNRFYDQLPNWNYYPGGLTKWEYSSVSTEMYYKVGLDGVTYTPAFSDYYGSDKIGVDPVSNRSYTELHYQTVSATHPTYTIYRSDPTQSVPTIANLGAPITLKSTNMALYMWDMRAFDAPVNYGWDMWYTP